jgi:hypothetical protein
VAVAQSAEPLELGRVPRGQAVRQHVAEQLDRRPGAPGRHPQVVQELGVDALPSEAQCFLYSAYRIWLSARTSFRRWLAEERRDSRLPDSASAELIPTDGWGNCHRQHHV